MILSIGLLGFASLQVQSLQASNDSYLRDRATHLADDIIHKLRANRTAALAQLYNQPAVGSLAVQNLNCELTVGCNSQGLAGNDLFTWNNALTANLPGGAQNLVGPAAGGATLPGGVGIVCIDSNPSDLLQPTPSPQNPQCGGPALPGGAVVYAIKIWWGNDLHTNPVVSPGGNLIPDGIPDSYYFASHQP